MPIERPVLLARKDGDVLDPGVAAACRYFEQLSAAEVSQILLHIVGCLTPATTSHVHPACIGSSSSLVG